MTATPVPLEQVESELLGLAFEAPSEWTRWTDPDAPETERVEFFFEDPADVDNADTVPEHPAIAVLAITEEEVADAGEYDTPEEVLRGAMLLDAEAITSFDHPLFPALTTKCSRAPARCCMRCSRRKARGLSSR